MGRRALVELAIDGLLVAGAAWLVFAWPFEPAPQQQPAIEQEGVRELRSPERQPGIPGSSERALALGPQAAPKRAALNDAEEPSGSLAQSDGALFVVTASRLNLRSAPDAASRSLGSYGKGELVEELDKRGNWVLVRVVADRTTGWMYGTYLGAAAEN